MKVTVGVADMKISRCADDVLVTYALGSCLGITIHDPVAGVGGMLHVMLPQSSLDPEKAAANPYMFVDTGVPRLFKECYKVGAVKERLLVKVAGGASARETEAEDQFQIGKRNFLMLRKLFWKNGVLIEGQDVGGHLPRTMSLTVATGAVLLRTNGQDLPL